ncbi:hypothetical protein Q4578_11100 [Shimia thalassica]|uniref:hypothetical protein n=1 Tax=Shimia thalassica TaxID=1715693 RepID=UPI0026E1BBB2|nr:hypothetical protein [Shimia thalassica]MDO6477974.1 hypothetical protein [Shimia thalassica]MDO6522137.1 hypothetical protein [Shimia thalassica]MDP2518967.1 hypothetical protein [Shimia thalassica]
MPNDDISVKLDLSSCINANHEKLCRVIWQSMVKKGVEHDGYRWAEPLSREEWAKRAGISVSTYTRLTRKDPIQKSGKGKGWGKDKVALLRVGDPDPNAQAKADHKYAADTMAKLYREHMAEAEKDPEKWVVCPREDWGRFNGLVDMWPDGWQVRIFKHTLKNWRDFMTLTKLELEIAWQAQECGRDVTLEDIAEDHTLTGAYVLQNVDLSEFRVRGKIKRVNGKRTRDPDTWRHYNRPYPRFLLLLQHVALELFRMDNPNFSYWEEDQAERRATAYAEQHPDEESWFGPEVSLYVKPPG